MTGTELLVKSLREIGEPACLDAANEIDALAARLAEVDKTLRPLVDDDNRPVEALARHAVARLAEAEALLRELRDRCEESGMGMVGIGHRIQVALGERAPDSAPAAYIPEIVAACAMNIDGDRGNCMICGTPVKVWHARTPADQPEDAVK